MWRLRAMLLSVPRIDQDKLSASTLVLADYMQHVDTKSIGTGMFVLGRYQSSAAHRELRYLRSFSSRTKRIGIYVKLYNFAPDENTHKPAGQVEYELVKTGTTDKLVELHVRT